MLRRCDASAVAAKPAYAAGGTFFDGLDFFDTTRWQKADGWANGDPFNVGRRADHVNFSGGLMTLQLDTATCSAGCSGKPLPSLPGKIMANMWAGAGVDSWLGPFTYSGTPITAKYDWIQYFVL